MYDTSSVAVSYLFHLIDFSSLHPVTNYYVMFSRWTCLINRINNLWNDGKFKWLKGQRTRRQPNLWFPMKKHNLSILLNSPTNLSGFEIGFTRKSTSNTLNKTLILLPFGSILRRNLSPLSSAQWGSKNDCFLRKPRKLIQDSLEQVHSVCLVERYRMKLLQKITCEFEKYRYFVFIYSQGHVNLKAKPESVAWSFWAYANQNMVGFVVDSR